LRRSNALRRSTSCHASRRGADLLREEKCERVVEFHAMLSLGGD